MADPTLDLALAFAQCVIAQDWAHAHSMCTGDLRACCAPEKLASEWQEVLAAVPGFVPNFARVNHWPKRIDQEEAAKLRFKTTPPSQLPSSCQ
jgi:predicted ester cyclase